MQLGPPEWRSGLRHCIIVLEALLQTRVNSRAVPQPAVAVSPLGQGTIVLVRGGGGWGALLGSSRPSDSLWQETQSVSFQMVPRICISLPQGLSYRQFVLGN